MVSKINETEAFNIQLQKDSVLQPKSRTEVTSIFKEQDLSAKNRSITNPIGKTTVIENNMDNEKTNKNTKIRKTLIWLSAGLAVASGIGLFIVNVRKYGTFSNKIMHEFMDNTKIGEKLKDAVNYAKEAAETPMGKIPERENGFLGKLFEHFFGNSKEIVKSTMEDKELLTEVKDFAVSRIKDNSLLISELSTAETAEKIKSAIELSGVGPTKMAQVISSNPELMGKIEYAMPELAKAIRSTRTECCFSRTIEEAAAFVAEAFEGKGYILEKELGAGTIGATYLAKTSEGKNIVIKLIKKGVTAEKLDAEEKVILDIISKIGGTGKDVEKIKASIGSLYKDWKQELDLVKSCKNSQLLSEGARRYSVAKVIDVAKDGKGLVMDLAEGIRMDKLVEILKDYKRNPAEFFEKYESIIKANPWLKDPRKVINELSPTLIKTFDEQFLFVKKGSQSIMHADPHTGNFFITANSKGKLIPQFIDTDNCIMRTSKQIQEDVGFFANYFVGNSRKIAEYFVNQCECNPQERARLVAEIGKDIKSYIFGRKNNITDFGVVQTNIQTILKKHGLTLSAENATAMKAQLQYLTAISESAHLAGKHTNILTVIKDIPRAVYDMITSGVNPLLCLTDAIKYAIQNKSRSLENLLQFFFRNPAIV